MLVFSTRLVGNNSFLSDSIRLDQAAMTPDVNGGDVVVPDGMTEEAMEEAEGKEKRRSQSIHLLFPFQTKRGQKQRFDSWWRM